MTYLRVKNWASFQHYSKRRPPWIKLYARLLMDDRFCELSEVERGQLLMVWLVASQSSRFTLDEEGKPTPVIAADERKLRAAIRGSRKIPLDRFISEGWLVPVQADELTEAVERSIADELRLVHFTDDARETLDAC